MISKSLVVKKSNLKPGFCLVYVQYPVTQLSDAKFYLLETIAEDLLLSKKKGLDFSHIVKEKYGSSISAKLIDFLKKMGAFCDTNT